MMRSTFVCLCCMASVAMAQPDPAAAPEPPAPAAPDNATEAAAEEQVEDLRDDIGALEALLVQARQAVTQLAQRKKTAESTSNNADDAAANATSVDRVPKRRAAGDASRELARATRDLEDAEMKRSTLEKQLADARAFLSDAELLLAQQRSLLSSIDRGEPRITAVQRHRLFQVVNRELGKSSLQQFTTARGGTLGIPSAAAIEGFQAGIDAKLLDGHADLFAQLGGIEITPTVWADAFGEVATFDIRRITPSADGSTSETFPETKLSMAGLRVRWRHAPLIVTELQSEQCLEMIDELERSRDASERTAAGNRALRACDVEEILGRNALDITVGARVLHRTSLTDEGEASNGGAIELLGSYTWQRPRSAVVFSAGSTALRLTAATDKLGEQTVEVPELTELRSYASLELRGSASRTEYDALPRVGTYGSYTRAWWDGAPANSWSRSEAEFGLYVGGRFQKNFQGIIAARVLNPFGDDGATFILSVMPSGNTSPEDAKRAASE